VEQDVTRDKCFSGDLIRRQELFLSALLTSCSSTILQPFHIIVHSILQLLSDLGATEGLTIALHSIGKLLAVPIDDM